MAQSDVLSLFNMQTPEQLRQDYLDKNMISPGQMGSQGLLQQVVSQMSNAGSMIGSAGGQLLGGKVAGEVEAAGIQQVMKDAAGRQFKNDSERYSFVAEGLDKLGLNKQAMLARKEANKSKLESLTTEAAVAKSGMPLTQPFSRIIKVPDGLGGTKEQTITETLQWDKENKTWIRPTIGTAGGGAAATGEASPKTEQQKAQDILDARGNNQATNAPPPEGGAVTPVPRQNVVGTPLLSPQGRSNEVSGRVGGPPSSGASWKQTPPQITPQQAQVMQGQLRKLLYTDRAAYWKMREELEQAGIDVEALTGYKQ